VPDSLLKNLRAIRIKSLAATMFCRSATNHSLSLSLSLSLSHVELYIKGLFGLIIMETTYVEINRHVVSYFNLFL
jgi:hypothetical protein